MGRWERTDTDPEVVSYRRMMHDDPDEFPRGNTEILKCI
jgi:hypothetical protein